MNTMSIDELMHILAAFRLLSNEKFSDKVVDIMKTKINSCKSDPNLLTEMFYSIINNIPKKHLKKIVIN